jgi:predicted acetyltransferase
MTLELVRVGAAEIPVLENLIQLYIHDFSEFFTGTPRCELSDDGRYTLDKPVGAWLAKPGNVALLMRSNGRLAGFAQISGTEDPKARRVVDEFFVARKYRRTGVGTAAAAMIFDLWPGRWQADVRRRNTGAVAFWARGIAAHPGVSDLKVEDRRDEEWDGPVYHFVIGPA